MEVVNIEDLSPVIYTKATGGPKLWVQHEIFEKEMHGYCVYVTPRATYGIDVVGCGYEEDCFAIKINAKVMPVYSSSYVYSLTLSPNAPDTDELTKGYQELVSMYGFYVKNG